MRKFIVLTVFVLMAADLMGCFSNSSSSGSSRKYIPPPQKAEKTLSFNNMITIDSTAYVMFPLLYDAVEQSDAYGSSNSRTSTYWNIVFYNTLTGKYHLLDSTRKMLIYQYDGESNTSGGPDTAAAHGFEYQPAKLLYYKVVVDDFNHDGKLNDDDPTYLFISDKGGNNFKQISPSGLAVTEYKVIDRSGKVMI